MKARFLMVVTALFVALCGCMEPAIVSPGKGEMVMPIPANHQMVSAADYGGTLPVTEIECPSDDADVQAADIRRPVAALLAQAMATQVGRYTWYYDQETPAFSFITFSTTSYDFPGSGGTIDVPDTQIGDVIYARLVSVLQNENAAPTGNGNRLRLAAIDDYGGAGETSPAAVPGARLYLSTPIGQMVSGTIEGEWTVTVAGTTRIRVEGRVNTGGGQQLIMQSAIYMMVSHTRP